MTTSAPPGPPRRVLPDRPGVVPVALWNAVFAEPEAVAGHVARAAVEEVGTAAWEWAAAEKASFPAAPVVTVAAGHAPFRLIRGSAVTRMTVG
ncbi:hypothetical protein SUDANB95_02558 [Actinosynnema sp. ALI-1.44]